MKRLLLLLLFGGAIHAGFSQVPGTISYQGILVDNTGAPVADANNHDIVFNFYDASSGGNLLATRELKFVTSYKGMFTCVIGNALNGAGNSSGGLNLALPASLFNGQVYVGVQPTDIFPGSELVPRIALTSVPYAVVAGTMSASGLTGTVANSALDPNLQDLADGSLTGSLIGPGVPAANISGALAVANFPNSGVTANSYGSASQIPVITVDAKGRITAASTSASTATVSNVTGTLPISVATGTTTPVVSISQSNNSTNGYLSSTDWTTFNAKIGPATVFGGDISGTHSTSLVAKIQGQSVSSNVPTLNQILQYNGATWIPATIATGGGTVTNVTGSLPISVATGSSTPAITIAKADGATNGYLSSTDWTTFNNKQATLSASNGLTLAANALSLGGTLTGNTAIASGGNNLVFTGAGSVGIGNAAPAQKLDVTGNINFTGALMVNSSAGSATNVLTSAGAGLAPTWSPVPVDFLTSNAVPRGNGVGMVTSNITSDGTNVAVGASIAAGTRLNVATTTQVMGLQVTNTFANAAVNTASRADGSGSTTTNYGFYGNAFSGTTAAGVYGSAGTSANSFGVYGTVGGNGITTGYGVYGNANSTSATNNYGIYGTAANGTNNWSGYFAGNILASSLYGPSDEKLKHDIRSFDESSVDLLKKISIKSYRFNEGGDFDLMNLPKGDQVGLLAADLEKVFPGLVTQAAHDLSMVRGTKGTGGQEDKIYFKAVNYTGLVPYLVKAIQEQQESIATLTLRIQELEQKANQVNQVVSQLDDIKKEMEVYRSILGVEAKKNK